MQISWYGFNYFKLQSSQSSLIFNPYNLDDNTKLTKANADVIVFSNPAKKKEAKMSEEAFVIDSPGEYEVKDVFVYGQQINGSYIYLVTFEDIKVAFMGEFGHTPLTDDDLRLIEDADILILPVGGDDLTTPKEAVKIINQVEPRIVIPSAHKAGMGKASAVPVNDFIKEFGIKAEEIDKLKVSKKDLQQEDVKLIVLKPQL